MKLTRLALIPAVLFATGIGVAHAQSYSDPGFYGALGYYDVSPKSNNGVLAGAFNSSINSDAEPTLTLGYRFQQGWGVEAWLPITKFEHDVSLDGAKSASIKHMPILLTVQYHFLSGDAWQPFVGLGYGWVSISGERTTGPIAGTNLNVKDASGFVGQFGLDYFATSNIFLRVDAKYFDWESDVSLNGAGIGQVKVNPWIYGVSVGYRF